MIDTLKMVSYIDLKEANMNKRNAINYRLRQMTRGIQTMMTGKGAL